MGAVPNVEPVVVAASEVVDIESGAEGEVTEIPRQSGAERQSTTTWEEAGLLEFDHGDGWMK